MGQIRRDIGKYLKTIRKKQDLSLNEVVADLSSYRVPCSHANLSRIEHGKCSVRHDIIAGLALIYGISTDEILFRGK